MQRHNPRTGPTSTGSCRTWAGGPRERRDPCGVGGDVRNAALRAMADAIRKGSDAILAANASDIASARERGLADSFIERMTLNEDRIEAMAAGIEAIAALPDPLGSVIAAWERPNGLRIERVRTPLGVIGIIFESRPNVTADAGALCLKAGNAAILRSGSDALGRGARNPRLHAAGTARGGASRRGDPARPGFQPRCGRRHADRA